MSPVKPGSGGKTPLERTKNQRRAKNVWMKPLLIIDGFNALHAGVLVGRDRAGWWQEAAQRRLVERVEQFVDLRDVEIWIVFDRRSSKEARTPKVTSRDTRIQINYAPSADDWIVEQVGALAGQRAVTVVTADRPLRERVRRTGGALRSPLQFLADCHSTKR